MVNGWLMVDQGRGKCNLKGGWAMDVQDFGGKDGVKGMIDYTNKHQIRESTYLIPLPFLKYLKPNAPLIVVYGESICYYH